MNIPLAYFITFTTYGTWLHGRDPGSVDELHNQFDTPFLQAASNREAKNRERMSQPPYLLDDQRRSIVRDAIVAECQFRDWSLLALHVRSNHVHMVVSAVADPETIMRMAKSHASRCLNRAGFESADRKRWTTHGSTRYIWNEKELEDRIIYTLDGQGEPMQTHRSPRIDRA